MNFEEELQRLCIVCIQGMHQQIVQTIDPAISYFIFYPKTLVYLWPLTDLIEPPPPLTAKETLYVIGFLTSIPGEDRICSRETHQPVLVRFEANTEHLLEKYQYLLKWWLFEEFKLSKSLWNLYPEIKSKEVI